MSTKKFTLEIELGNAAMQHAEDIQYILDKVRGALDERVGQQLHPVHSRRVHDINGNTVGAWNIEVC